MAICSMCPSGCDVSVTSTVIVSDPPAKVAAVQSLKVTGAGTAPAGATSLSFFNYGPASVTVGGTELAPRAALSYPFLGQNLTYPAIAYDATGSEMRIDYTVIP